MKQLGLIGYPLSHSFSKKYFSKKFIEENIEGFHYELFPIERIEDLPELIKNQPNLIGLNVTIPYKQQVIPYMDSLSDAAKAIGAVNTIIVRDGKLTGDNSDVYGFEVSLKKELQSHHKKALILGTGGAAKAVAYVLKKLGITFKYVSRKPSEGQLSYKDLNKQIIHEYPVIINTTPLGMSPNIDSCPDIPYDFIDEKSLLYDLVYNPLETLFLKKGKDSGATIINGLEMLHLQAEKSWQIWND